MTPEVFVPTIRRDKSYGQVAACPYSLLILLLQLPYFLHGLEIICFIPYKMISFFEFPDYVPCPVNLTDTCLKDQVIIYSGDDFGLKDGFESNIFITEIPYDRQIVLSLLPLF